MMVDDLNASGGLLGREVEAVVVDPASDWPLFAEKARELIEKEQVAAVFGCWTSRVAQVRPASVRRSSTASCSNPVQYEGEESSRNVFYTGARAQPAGDPRGEYLMSEEGGGAERWVLLGHRLRLSAHHQQDPPPPSCTPRRRGQRHHGGIHALRTFGLADHRRRGHDFAAARQAHRDVVSTINGDAQRPLLQGARQPGHRRRGPFPSSPSRSARRNCRASTPDRWWVISRLELFHVGRRRRERRFRRQMACLPRRRGPRGQRPDGSPLHRLPDVGAGGASGGLHRCRRGAPGDVRPDRHRPVGP